MEGTRNFKYYLAGSVSLITFVIYLTSLKNDFVLWDDDIYILDNPFIRSFNTDFFKRAFFGFYDSNWFPLTWISHALDYALWGLNPMGHHLTNNILHAVNTFLVVLLVVRLMEGKIPPAPSGNHNSPTPPSYAKRGKAKQGGVTPSAQDSRMTAGSEYPVPGPQLRFTIHDSRFTMIAAITTGLLFGLHPVHVESVAWVAERKDLLCALFYLLSIMAYTKYLQGAESKEQRVGDNVQEAKAITQGSVSSMRYALCSMRFRSLLFALCFFILALLSKPMAVSLPLVLLILDWYPFQRIQSPGTFRTALLEKLPFIVLSLGSSILTLLAQKAGGAIGSLENASLPIRAFVAFKAAAGYLLKMAFPFNLIPFYPYPRTIMVFSLEYLLPIAAAAGITIASLVIAKKQKLWISAWGYYVITLLPVLGILRIGSQEMADRYTYLPSLGPFLIAGLGAAWFWQKVWAAGRRRSVINILGYSTALFLFVCMSYLTVKQIHIWKNSDTLWTYVIEKKPNVPKAYKNRAVYFIRSGQYDKAAADYDKVLFLDPSNYDAYLWRIISLNALVDRGNKHYRQGNKELAISDFQKACELGNEAGCNSLKTLGIALPRGKY